MARNDTSRRQQLSGNIKSAIATAAIVGTLGGWVAFGSQQAATTIDTSTAVAQSDTSVVTSGSSAALPSTSAQSGTTAESSSSAQSGTTAQPSTGATQSSTQRAPVARTRSSR